MHTEQMRTFPKPSHGILDSLFLHALVRDRQEPNPCIISCLFSCSLKCLPLVLGPPLFAHPGLHLEGSKSCSSRLPHLRAVPSDLFGQVMREQLFLETTYACEEEIEGLLIKD